MAQRTENVLVRVSGRGSYHLAHLFAEDGNTPACGAHLGTNNWDAVNPRRAGRSLTICPQCQAARRAQQQEETAHGR